MTQVTERSVAKSKCHIVVIYNTAAWSAHIIVRRIYGVGLMTQVTEWYPELAEGRSRSVRG